MTIDAMKRAQLEADARGFDTRQDHWPETFGTGESLDRDAAWIKQDGKGRHNAHPKTRAGALQNSQSPIDAMVGW